MSSTHDTNYPSRFLVPGHPQRLSVIFAGFRHSQHFGYVFLIFSAFLSFCGLSVFFYMRFYDLRREPVHPLLGELRAARDATEALGRGGCRREVHTWRSARTEAGCDLSAASMSGVLRIAACSSSAAVVRCRQLPNHSRQELSWGCQRPETSPTPRCAEHELAPGGRPDIAASSRGPVGVTGCQRACQPALSLRSRSAPAASSCATTPGRPPRAALQSDALRAQSIAGAGRPEHSLHESAMHSLQLPAKGLWRGSIG